MYVKQQNTYVSSNSNIDQDKSGYFEECEENEM